MAADLARDREGTVQELRHSIAESRIATSDSGSSHFPPAREPHEQLRVPGSNILRPNASTSGSKT